MRARIKGKYAEGFGAGRNLSTDYSHAHPHKQHLFHTGVAATHTAQDHTKHTSSRRHPLVEDGGIVDKDMQAQTASHVHAKQVRHQQEDYTRQMKNNTRQPTHPGGPPRPWTTSGEAPTREQVNQNDGIY